MSLKMKVWTFLDIALRVPPIFLMDAALKYGIDIKEKVTDKLSVVEKHQYSNGTYQWLSAYALEEVGISMFSLLIYVQVFITALFVFLFNTKQLVSLYIRILSIGIIILAYKLNVDFVNAEISHRIKDVSSLDFQRIYYVTSNYLFQVILASIFSFTNTINAVSHTLIWLLFLTSVIASALSVPDMLLRLTPALAAAGSAILLAYSLYVHGLRVCETVYKGVTWCHSVVENYGLYTMLETHWVNLHIPQVFRAFWIIRLAEYAVINLGAQSFHSWSIKQIIKDIIINGSDNVVSLLGMTSVVAFICQGIGYCIQSFLLVRDPTEKSIGNVSAVLFLVLSLQTGITGLDPETRFHRTSRNICLLYAALMHFAYNILNPILLSLSASRTPSINKHVRALSVTLLLIVSPACLLVYQWTTQVTNTWLLAITSFMVELIIKTVASLLIYILFIIDAYKNGLWEKLDDYVYYLTACASSIELILGVYLLFNGIWIFLFESTSAIRACMMCLHAYFNIWIQGKNGWESFLLRRSALQKINHLPEATTEQLIKRSDVCAICFQDLKSARITNCNHYFHGICLRKWLNVQDICPLCQNPLYDTKSFDRTRYQWEGN